MCFPHAVRYHIIHDFSHMLTDGHSDAFVLHWLSGKKMRYFTYYCKDFGKFSVFKLIHIFGNFCKRFGFSLMYLKGRTIIAEIMM